MDEVARFGTASVAQVAHLLSREEEQVLAEALRLTGEGSAVRGWLTAEAVAALVNGVERKRPLAEADPFIIKAFGQAQERSKPEWTSMTIPVLKNRLLQVSSQTFREMDYGSPNIWHFVTLFPHLLRTDGVRPGERVHLVDPSIVEPSSTDESAALDPVGRGRIRVDLWRAVFDYSSGKEYVWDDTVGRARLRAPEDVARPIIPTLGEEDLRGLRDEFVQTQDAISEHDSNRLNDWVEGAGATAALPRFYRGLWNAHLKSHAADRLRAFFVSEGLAVPVDMLERVADAVQPESDVERARRAAHRYVDAMTGEELARLSIEIAVVMRVPLRDEAPK
ncbi:hypothetical protein [Microbacterium sp. TWP3-1-2b2]|uniref:hypothetical protein n=1 Tax=Microbacterium sp. TWP3-1-2b2 TaxID=2804651 RepID=UPI003CE70828